ncbi:hypothetical protein C8A01DRAFT_38530 [Parachaetomium inaequale]|uniref:Uncharacterized protein n=1 Tax=Parachaetomium inaequale TaxID=2588326 RepID=A0AAN6PE17_9PEZI|nr:hypothetical protein C8A01DRAFT_38530 [Parachaetomium inaequale]
MPVIANNLDIRGHDLQLEAGKDTVYVNASNTVAWIVVAVVGGAIVIGCTLAFVFIYYIRRRRVRRDSEQHPFLTRDGIVKRRTRSGTELSEEEEARRRHIIRKSLATRSSCSAGSGLSATVDQVDRELEEIERQESTRLKDDWKQWEARVRHERSVSGDQHPAASAASGVPILAIPTPAKHRSPGETPSPSPPPSPPVPPRHPGRRSAS